MVSLEPNLSVRYDQFETIVDNLNDVLYFEVNCADGAAFIELDENVRLNYDIIDNSWFLTSVVVDCICSK